MASRVYLLVTLVLTSVTLTLACSPMEGVTTLSDVIHGSDAVLLASVVRHYPDRRFSQAYTAELNVFCVLKADNHLQIPARVNLTEAGIIEGKCVAAEVAVGSNYIIPVSSSGGVLTPYDAPMEGTPENMNRVSAVCGLQPRQPAGVSSGPGCPSVDSNGCIIGQNHDDHHDDHEHGDHHDDHSDHHGGQDVTDHGHDDHHNDDHHDHHDDHDDDDHHDDHHDDHEHGDHHDDHSDHHGGQDVTDHGHDDHHDDDDHHDHHDDHDHDMHHEARAAGVHDALNSANVCSNCVLLLLLSLAAILAL